MRLNGFDLNQVLCLEALLNERNVSRAAERVHLSQSAMSWVLAQLREHFHDPLLVRSGRKLVLTPFGQSLLGPVSEFLASAHALTALAPSQATADADRELKVAASDYSLAAFLAPAIQQTAARMPKLRFDVLPLTSNSSHALHAGEVDLLFAGQALDVGIPPNELLFQDPFACLVCEQRGPRGKSVSRQHYMAQDHVVLRYFEHRLAFEDETALRREGLKRIHRIAVWSVTQVPELIVNTPMIATVPSGIAKQLCERWPLRMMPFPFSHDPSSHFVYWHPSRNADPVVSGFLEVVRDTVTKSR